MYLGRYFPQPYSRRLSFKCESDCATVLEGEPPLRGASSEDVAGRSGLTDTYEACDAFTSGTWHLCGVKALDWPGTSGCPPTDAKGRKRAQGGATDGSHFDAI